MFVRRLKVDSYRGLKGLDIEFNGPVDKKNSVNVIVGKNGSGKTTILEMISNWFATYERDIEYGAIDIVDGVDVPTFEKISTGEYKRTFVNNLQAELNSLSANESPPFKYPQFIYLPAMLQFHTRTSKNPRISYQISAKLEGDLLSNTSDYITSFVISHERMQEESSAKERLKNAVDAFNKPFKSLNLATKLADLASNSEPLFENADGERFPIDGLSDGEKQIFTRMVGLMMLQPRNSVILIDEPEIAIHPAWQYRILEIYKEIGFGNQFIITTHSPQILSSVSWNSVNVLVREKNLTKAIKRLGPPTGIDSDSILSEIMGAEFYHPDLNDLKTKYREFFDNGSSDDEVGSELRKTIENIESRDSEFFQELRLLDRLKQNRNEKH